MNNALNQRTSHFWTSLTAIILVGMVLSALPAAAQQYIEPTSPSGGSTAWPLNSSANAQVKRGTLIIGQTGGNAKLCLNTNDPNDATNCISSWTNAGSFVRLKNLVPGNGYSATDLRAYETADTGYARIQATGNNLYTVIVEANASSPSTSTGLIATDGGNAANYAANFQGKVFVGFPSTLADAKLCLNGEFTIDTSPGDSSFGKGCITSWSQIAAIAAAGNYVVLQPSTSIPAPQSGQISVSGGGSFASASNSAVVVGAPAAGTPISVTCGDGICNANECSTNTTPACSVGSANYCAFDCDRTAPGNVTMNTDYAVSNNPIGNYITVSGFNWTFPADSDYVGTRIIRTSTTPATGPTYPGALVQDIVGPAHTFNDPTHLSYNTNHYYMFYAYDGVGNFSSGVQIRVYHSSGLGGGGGGGSQTGGG